MSEHTWILENIAAYLAGGLEMTERERLEQHTAGCASCAAALQEVNGLDRSLDAIFVGVRPGPMLEDRLIRSLRATPQRRPRGFAFRFVLGAAATLLLAVIGAGISALIVEGDLPFPGSPLRLFARGTPSQAMFGLPSKENRDESPVVVNKYVKQSPPQLRSDVARDESWDENIPAGPAVYKDTKQAEAHSPVTLSDGEAKQIVAGATGSPSDWSGSMRSPNGNTSPTTDGTSTTIQWQEKWGKESKNEAIPPTSGIPPGTTGGVGGTTYSYLNYAPAPPKPPTGNLSDLESKAGDKVSGSGTSLAFGLEPPKPAEGMEHSPAKVDYFKPTDLAVPTSETKPEARPVDKPADPAATPPPAATPAPEPKAPEPAKAGVPPVTLPHINRLFKNVGETEPATPEAPPVAPATPLKVIIRTGEIEFEVESFDPAVATVTRLVNAIQGAFITTVNSDKLPNGKVRGALMVRVPPESLDGLVLDLRKELGKQGELKGQRIGSQDITKQYTDLDSRLRAARAMEERLLRIIKEGKGEIKDLLAAEKELGVWRTKIEESEGELRYYRNQVALSTLTVTLYEKEIKAPSAVIETEHVRMGIEVEDVDKGLRSALSAVSEAKGRVTKSEVKQRDAGQLSAILEFEVAPAAAGPLRDRLKQIGTLARLEIDRQLQAEGGSGRPGEVKTTQNDTQFSVSLYNLTNVAPRETVNLSLACTDADATYKTILARVEKSAGRIVTSSLNRQRDEQTRGEVVFEVKTAEADAVLQEFKSEGEVMRLQVTENADTQNVTRAKRGFNVQVWSLGSVAPRETATLQVAAKDVPAAYHALQEAVSKAKGRILNARLNEENRQNITAQLDFEVRRTEEASISAALASAGDIYTRNVTRAADSETVVDSKVRLEVRLVNRAAIPPRESVTLGIEVPDVDQASANFSALVSESQGRVIEAHVTHERNGQVTAKLVYDVPLSSAPALVEKFKGAGVLRLHQSTRNPQVPEGDLASARLDVTLSNADLIVPRDDGLWPQVRKGLSWSFTALAFSLTWLVVGVCVLLPWAILIWVGYRIVLRLRRRPETVPPTA